MKIELPYGLEKIEVEIPDENFIGVIEPKDIQGLGRTRADIETKVKMALRHPLDSPPLSSLVKSNSNVTVIATDISRPCPDYVLLHPLLEELNEAGVSDNQIKIVIATGMHRPMTEKELRDKLSEEVYERVHVVNHVCTDEESLKYVGQTPNLNIPLWVNKEVVDADFVISTGMVDPHIFAGYTGGGKSVLPGVSGLKTIEETHKPERLDLPTVGICLCENNPIRMDMDEAGKMAGLKFIVNIALNLKYEVAAISTGNIVTAHRELVKFVDTIAKVKVSSEPDIVVSAPGYPKDRDLYQATRAANNFVCGPKPVIKKGGVIIIPAPCQDGVGSETFYYWMKEAKTLDDILERGRREPDIGAHRPYIMAKILKHADVIIVGSKIPDKVEEMKMIAAKDMDEALETAFSKVGKKAKTLITTHGLTVVPIVSC
ncbi:MAG: nickel-dependent lactate racemase [Candidatus Bathyarchaeia archaeon]